MTTIRLSGPPDVLTVLPYQLGFHPHQCAVVVSLHGSRLGLIQRIDLPPPEHVRDAVAALIAPLRQENPSAVLIIGYEERAGESRAMLDELGQAFTDCHVTVSDRMVVRDGRWFDLDCTRSCCPPEGLPLPPPSAVPAVAEFVVRGVCPLPDRYALADLLEPDRSRTSPHPAEVSRLAGEWLQLRVEAQDAGDVGHLERDRDLGTREANLGSSERQLGRWETELHRLRASELAVWALVLCCEDDATPIRMLPPQDLAILAVSVSDVGLRDALIAWLCPGTLPEDLIDRSLSAQMSRSLPIPPCLLGDVAEIEEVIGRQRIERRLCELSAALPDRWAVSTLTVLASFTWWRGDGALTRVALDRALRIDPHYRLAQLLERMVDLAIRPEQATA